MKNHILNRLAFPVFLNAALLSALCVLISAPPVWNMAYRHTMAAKLMAYPKGAEYLEDSKRISEGRWSRDGYETINKSLKAYFLLPVEQKHYEDVRGLLHLALAVSLLLIAILWLAQKLVEWRGVWAWALGVYVALAATFGIWSMISFRHLFRTLHWWIFQDNSWIMPKGSYSLFLYPHAIWKVAVAFVMAGCFLSLLGGMVIARLQHVRRQSRLKLES